MASMEVVESVRVTLEVRTDAAYLYLKEPIARGEASRQEVIDLPSGDMVVVDFDDSWRMLGVEIIGASAVLPEGVLTRLRSSTQRPQPPEASR